MKKWNEPAGAVHSSTWSARLGPLRAKSHSVRPRNACKPVLGCVKPRLSSVPSYSSFTMSQPKVACHQAVVSVSSDEQTRNGGILARSRERSERSEKTKSLRNAIAKAKAETKEAKVEGSAKVVVWSGNKVTRMRLDPATGDFFGVAPNGHVVRSLPNGQFVEITEKELKGVKPCSKK